MLICKGEVKGSRCKHFEEEFQACGCVKRGGDIKKDLRSCKHYFPAQLIEDHEEVKYYPSTDAVIQFIHNIKESNKDDNDNTFKNYVQLPSVEQLFVYYFAVEKLKPKAIMAMLYKDLDEKQRIRKSKHLFSKNMLLTAIEEFSNTTTSKLLKIKSEMLSLKTIEYSEDALDQMYTNYKDGMSDVKANDIIMASKLVADTVAKQKKATEDLGGAGITLTFADGETLLETIRDLPKLPEKRVIVEEK